MAGRASTCGSCKTVSTAEGLAFREDRGPGSRWATDICTCGYAAIAHEPVHPTTGRPGITDHPFTARGPADTDSHYCGCRGWD